jgi:hypothetical protein
MGQDDARKIAERLQRAADGYAQGEVETNACSFGRPEDLRPSSDVIQNVLHKENAKNLSY